MFTKNILFLLAVTIIGIGCSSEMTTAPDASENEIESSIDAASLDVPTSISIYNGSFDPRKKSTFVVRIENVSKGTTLMLSNGETVPVPHAPGVWTVSRYANTFFTPGRYDRGKGLEALAEDGNPAVLAANIEASPFVSSSGVFNTPDGEANPAPATPGKAYQFTVTAYPGEHLSFATMFVQSNDLFYAPLGNGIPLFDRNKQPLEGDVTRFVKLWDAGTEVNQEPGLGFDQAPRQSGPNTGESEFKRIQEIRSNNFESLQVRGKYQYPATEEVIKVTITPVENAASENMTSLEY